MLKKKLKSKTAFTLAETLVATLIMLMVSAIMVTGIPAAKNAYEKVFVKSNAEILMSTATYALRNEMTGARDIEVEDGKTVTYLNASYGSYSRIFIDSTNDVDKKDNIMYQRYAYKKNSESAAEGAPAPQTPVTEPLVSNAASDGMKVTYSKAEYFPGKGYITFSDLVVKDKDGKQLLKPRDLSISTF